MFQRKDEDSGSGFDMETVTNLLQGENPVRMLWDRLSAVPGGRTVFSKAVGLLAPYTGTISPHVAELRDGYCRVEMDDRRRVRNHLNSIHAMALTNLSEVTSGLVVTYTLPEGMRGILTGFDIEYTKKARGRLSAESDLVLPELGRDEEREIDVPVTTRDEDRDVVTRATARWLVGPTG
jgi:acyl-coenzyme A thioesterase PaaI-like protein